MHDAVLIVGDYGRHWEVLPVTATRDGRTFIFADHRTPITKIARELPGPCVEVFLADQPREARMTG